MNLKKKHIMPGPHPLIPALDGSESPLDLVSVQNRTGAFTERVHAHVQFTATRCIDTAPREFSKHENTLSVLTVSYFWVPALFRLVMDSLNSESVSQSLIQCHACVMPSGQGGDRYMRGYGGGGVHRCLNIAQDQ